LSAVLALSGKIFKPNIGSMNGLAKAMRSFISDSSAFFAEFTCNYG
jgi:hypothetical protein